MSLSRNDVHKIRLKYPGRIPIIIKKDPKLQYYWSCKGGEGVVKILAPESMTMFDLKLEILSKLKSLNHFVSDAIYLSSGNHIVLCNNVPISYVLDKHGRDGVIYMTIHSENVFG